MEYTETRTPANPNADQAVVKENADWCGEVARASHAGQDGPTPIAQQLCVLIVEDDPLDIDLELLALKKGGWEAELEAVQTADDFREHIRAKNYEVILVDYRLPGWKGIEALEILR